MLQFSACTCSTSAKGQGAAASQARPKLASVSQLEGYNNNHGVSQAATLDVQQTQNDSKLGSLAVIARLYDIVMYVMLTDSVQH